MPASLEIRLSLDRPEFHLDVDLRLPGRGITVLFGPSGSGKTTLLRCVAGLERAKGRIAVGPEVWQDSLENIFRPAWARDLGYVFQEASLFEHLTVKENLRYGLKRVNKPGGQAALKSAIDLLGIGHLLDRSPESLSGGERQRVAIARALAMQPRLLLLDEPLAALDIGRKKEILPWIEQMHTSLEIPVLYVTHAIEELARLADHVVTMNHGGIQHSGDLNTVMSDARIAAAFGEDAGIIIAGKISALDPNFHLAEAAIEGGSLWVRGDQLAVGDAIRVRILARDVSLSLLDQSETTIQNRLRGIIEHIDPDRHPSQALVTVRCGGRRVLSRVTYRALETLALKPGATVWCQVKSAALIN